MFEFTPSRIGIDSQVLQLLEAISHKQGELSTQKRDISGDLQIESVAPIDAVPSICIYSNYVSLGHSES